MKVRFVATAVLVAALSGFSHADSSATGALHRVTGASSIVAGPSLNFSPMARDSSSGGDSSLLASSAFTFKKSVRATAMSEGSESAMLAMGVAGILIAMRKKFR
jgi:hypothetical protein